MPHRQIYSLAIREAAPQKMISLYEWLLTIEGWMISGLTPDFNFENGKYIVRDAIETLRDVSDPSVRATMIRVFFEKQEDYVYAKLKFG